MGSGRRHRVHERILSPQPNQPCRTGSAELVAFARAAAGAGEYVGGHGVVVDWSRWRRGAVVVLQPGAHAKIAQPATL
jgi:hypothetical protein